MCLYPRLIANKKYLPNRKNNYNPPILHDIRLKYVSIGCGKCIECRKQKANNWRIRLTQEILSDNVAQFVTLTFSEEALNSIMRKYNIEDANLVAGIAVRRFLERWRKKHTKSVKHWLITELGHQGTERIHLHGLIWTDNKEDIKNIWGYGYVFIGEYVGIRTINYIVKYVTKLDADHKTFEGQIFASAGIGKAYNTKGENKELLKVLNRCKYKGKDTQEYWRAPTGQKLALPIYYRNYIYNEEQRELLWLQKIEEAKTYVLGVEYQLDNAEHQLQYFEGLHAAQKHNKRIGYGDDSAEWKKESYRAKLREINAN